MSDKIKIILYSILLSICLYIGVVSCILNFKYPELTQMQILLHIPRTVLLDFSK